jgi:signal transduction histidine kinase
MSQKMLRGLTPFLVSCAHLVAFIQLQWSPDLKALPSKWILQSIILLGFSALIVFILPFIHRLKLILPLLAMQGFILYLIGLPSGGYLGVELALLTALIIEVFEYLLIWQALLFSSGLTLMVLYMKQISVNAWGIILPPSLKHDLLSFGFFGAMIIVLNLIIRFQKDNQVLAVEVKKSFQEGMLHLAQINMQLQEYAALVEQRVVIEERKRLSREIHDTFAYTLTNLMMMLEAAKYLTKPDEIELLKQIEVASNHANEGVTEVHRALQALRPGQLMQATGLTAIQNLINTFIKATHIKIELSLGNVPLNLGEDVDLVAYRFVQEGITNALRHGRATEISVLLSLVEQKIHILIKDNGIGANNAKEGYGLAGMRERIDRLGGRLEIAHSVCEGFRLLAVIPIPKEATNEKASFVISG